MGSLEERNRILRESWVNARYRVPETPLEGQHFSVETLGVIKDHHLNGGEEFVDIVSWWPASKQWTVTHQCRQDEDAADHPCTVTFWQDLPPLPWG